MKKTNATDLLALNQAYLGRVSDKFGTEIRKKNSRMFCCGKVCSEIADYAIGDVHYYKFMLECDRNNNNTSDVIPVIIEKTKENAACNFLKFGKELTIIGSFRSNNFTDHSGKRHLDVFLQATDFAFGSMYSEAGFDSNIVVLKGYICTEPTFKVTQSKRYISEFRIAVSNENGEPDYIPVIVWGTKAVEVYQKYNVGDKLSLVGRVQSRRYYKKAQQEEDKGESLIAYEVSSRYMRRTYVKDPDKPWRELKSNHPFPVRPIEFFVKQQCSLATVGAR